MISSNSLACTSMLFLLHIRRSLQALSVECSSKVDLNYAVTVKIHYDKKKLKTDSHLKISKRYNRICIRLKSLRSKVFSDLKQHIVLNSNQKQKSYHMVFKGILDFLSVNVTRFASGDLHEMLNFLKRRKVLRLCSGLSKENLINMRKMSKGRLWCSANVFFFSLKTSKLVQIIF